MIDHAQLVLRLDDLIDKHGGSMRKACKKIGYSESQMWRVRAGKSSAPDWLLRELGLRRVTMYEQV